MNDLILERLRTAGYVGRPSATLERDGAMFALFEENLVYLDDTGAHDVILRDITRIHSDREGVLRVETPQGVSIAASLLGFDVPRVQHFFAEVRHATARVKSLPTPPATTAGSPWKTGWAVGGSAAPAPQSAAPVPARASEPIAAGPAAAPAPVSTQPSTVRPAEDPAPEQTAKPGVLETAAPDFDASERPETEPLPSLTPKIPDLAPYARTMRLLALLLGVAGLGSGVLSYQAGETVQGLWTFGTSIVGAFALYVLGEALKVIAATHRLVATREQP